jgi:hypothetical protein
LLSVELKGAAQPRQARRNLVAHSGIGSEAEHNPSRRAPLLQHHEQTARYVHRIAGGRRRKAMMFATQLSPDDIAILEEAIERALGLVAERGLQVPSGEMTAKLCEAFCNGERSGCWSYAAAQLGSAKKNRIGLEEFYAQAVNRRGLFHSDAGLRSRRE